MLNPEVLKCHRKTKDNKFYIYVKTLTSLAIWGPGGGGGVQSSNWAHLGSHIPSI